MAKRLSEKTKRQKKSQEKVMKNVAKAFQASDELIDELWEEIFEWRRVSNCTSPYQLNNKLKKLNKLAETKKHDTTPDFSPDLLLDPLCTLYFNSDFEYPKISEKEIQTVDDFYALMTIIRDKILADKATNDVMITMDPFQFLEFFKYLFETGYRDDESMNQVFEVLSDEQRK